MSDYLDVIESINAEAADSRRLFGDAGTAVSTIRERRSQNPRYMSQLTEAAEFLADVHSGRRPMWQMQEAMTTSDFPLLFADVLDRQLLGRYRETIPTYRSYARVSTVRDFRPAKRFAVDGAEGLLPEVAEKAPYPAAELTDHEDQLQVHKRGRRIHMTWEDFVNDDLDAFRDNPDRLARGARRSEEHFATTLFIDANGPHTGLYVAAAGEDPGNIVEGNPALSITALQDAFTLLASQRDRNNQPILIDAVTLVVPPALEVVANNILNATEIVTAAGSGPAASDEQRTDRITSVNWMRSRVTLEVNYYIPHVASDANGNTSWALFASPGSSRPALEMAFLRQHQEPALFMRLPDARSIGGAGGPDPEMASFENDSNEIKVRHVFGGTRLVNTGGRKSTVASNGSGA